MSWTGWGRKRADSRPELLARGETLAEAARALHRAAAARGFAQRWLVVTTGFPPADAPPAAPGQDTGTEDYEDFESGH